MAKKPTRKPKPEMSEADRIALGQRIRDRLESLDMMQADLADRAGYRALAINELINGKTKSPSAEILRAVARVLGVGLDELLGETPTRADGEPLAPEEEVELAIRRSGLKGEAAQRFREQRQSVGQMPLEALIAWAKSIASGKSNMSTGLEAKGKIGEGEQRL